MPVTCKEEGRRLTAAVSGELDHHGARAVMEELDRCIDMTLPRELTLDLGGLTFTDSSGIAVLLRAHRRMGQVRGGHAGDPHAAPGGQGVPGRGAGQAHPL